MLFAAIVAALFLVSTATAAPAPTPRSAYTAIRACLLHAGARTVTPQPGWAGTGRWPGGYRWFSWSYMTLSGRVIGVATATSLTGSQRQAAKACTSPYNA